MAEPVHLLVSRCLLGDDVRYDGRPRGLAALGAVPPGLLRITAACPEVEAGLPVPREPIVLEGEADAPRVLGRHSATDVTERLRAAVAARLCLPSPAEGGPEGAILKARSPSCGAGDAPWAPAERGERTRPAAGVDGLFVAALRRDRPDLPRIDEEALVSQDSVARRAFFEALAAARRRAGRDPAPVHALCAAFEPPTP